VLYLKNATYIDSGTLEITTGHLGVSPDPSKGYGFQSLKPGLTQFVDAIPPDAPTIDCSGKIVTASFAIGHHHIYSALARGMPMPARFPCNFVEILEFIWWNLDKKLDAEMIRASAMVAGLEAARCGCTFIIDHHASPNAPEGSLQIIADALDEIGLAHLLCYELSDRDGGDCLKAGLAESEAYLKHNQSLVGVHASFTVSPELLERAVGMADDYSTGIHIHVAEDPADGRHCRETFDCSLARRLRDAGALESAKSLLAHCLHLDDEEREIVRESNAWVVHNTQSNQNNNVGAFDPRGLGERVFIGTDGMHSDMLAAARAAYLEGQAMGGLSPLEAYERMRYVHWYLGDNDFQGDYDNNLVILDYPTPTPITSENWPAHVVYGLTSAHVHSVISDGQLIVENGRHTFIDEERELALAREQAERLWKML